MLPVNALFNEALSRHKEGRHGEAERLYRQILAAHPRHADCLHLLGVLAHEGGRSDLAVSYIRQAISINGREAVYHNNLGNAWAGQGNTVEACAAFRQALALSPDFVEAHNNLGLALEAAGDAAEAERHFERAIELSPDLAQAHNNLGNVRAARGDVAAAVASFERALQLSPDYAEAHNNLGLAMLREGKVPEALTYLSRSAMLNPDVPETHNNFGTALLMAERWGEAADAFRAALGKRPDFAPARLNLEHALERWRHEADRAAQADESEALLHAGLAEAWRRDDAAIDIDQKMIAHPHCPAGGEFYASRVIFGLFALGLISLFVLDGAWALAFIAALAAGYVFVGRHWVNRKMIAYARTQILADPALFRRMWRFGGVTIRDRRSGNASGLVLVGPRDDWRLLARKFPASESAKANAKERR